MPSYSQRWPAFSHHLSLSDHITWCSINSSCCFCCCYISGCWIQQGWEGKWFGHSFIFPGLQHATACRSHIQDTEDLRALQMLPGIVCSTSGSKHYWCKINLQQANNAKFSHNALKQEKSWNTWEIRYAKSTIRNFLVQLFEQNFLLTYAFVSDMMCSIFTRYGLFSLFHWAYLYLTEIGSVPAVRDILELGILSQKYSKELMVYMCNLTLVWCQTQKKSCHAVPLLSQERTRRGFFKPIKAFPGKSNIQKPLDQMIFWRPNHHQPSSDQPA